MGNSQIFDVLIVGGGPAGLSCALALARLVHSNVLFNSGVYRNALSHHMYTLPTWDHKDPADFRAATRRDISTRYSTTRFEEVKIESIESVEKGLFMATDARGTEWLGKKVVLATGVTDVFPDICGYDECWVKGIFHCLFCHGYESRGSESAGVLAVDDLAKPMALLPGARQSNQLARNVTIYTNNNPALASSTIAALDQSPTLHVDDRRIKKLAKGPKDSEVIVQFEDGSEKVEGFIYHKPVSKLNGPWAEQLGLEITVTGDYKVSYPFNETNVHGVFAAGDCGTPMKAVASAVTAGGAAGAGAAFQIEAGA